MRRRREDIRLLIVELDARAVPSSYRRIHPRNYPRVRQEAQKPMGWGEMVARYCAREKHSKYTARKTNRMPTKIPLFTNSHRPSPLPPTHQHPPIINTPLPTYQHPVPSTQPPTPSFETPPYAHSLANSYLAASPQVNSHSAIRSTAIPSHTNSASQTSTLAVDIVNTPCWH